jgi:hypothetical protein
MLSILVCEVTQHQDDKVIETRPEHNVVDSNHWFFRARDQR